MTLADDRSQPHPGEAADRLAHARRRVAALKGFYIHLIVFVLVVGGLSVINLLMGRPWWVLWVLFGWGIGLLAHAIGTLGSVPRLIADWERRKLQQYMRE